MITASEDLKLETKANENSQIEEKMEAKLNVEVKEDTGQGSMEGVVTTVRGSRAIRMILGSKLVQDLIY